MVTKSITQSDLQSLENKIKLDWEKEFKDHRHSFGNKVQEDYNKMDSKVSEYNVNLKLNNQTMQRMQEDITEIKKLLTDFKNTIQDTYVTKEQLDPIKEKQKDHDAIIKRLAWGAFLLLLSLIGGFIGLSKYM